MGNTLLAVKGIAIQALPERCFPNLSSRFNGKGNGSVSMTKIFIHGLGQTPDSWSNTLSHFNTENNIICPDLSKLIRGKSTDYNTLYSRFTDLCNIHDRPLDLCGLSLGAVLALNYAIDHPDRIHSLVLIAPQYHMPKRLLQFQNIIFHIMPRSAFKSTGFDKEDFLRLCNTMSEIDLSRSLDRINCPVLIVYGEKDRANKKAAVSLNKLLKRSVLREISKSGHEVNLDAPQRLSRLIAAFYKHIHKT